MPKVKEDRRPDTLQRFEGALRKALGTPPDAPRAKTKRKAKKKRAR